MQVHAESSNLVDRSRGARRRRGWLRLFADVFFLAKRDRTWWILPLILLLLIVAALLAFVALAGPLAPFIYPLL